MSLSPFEWSVIGALATLAIGVIAFFLKRTMNKTDEHDKDISHIKQTYVTKEDLKELKSEFQNDIEKISSDVAEIKDNYLKQNDFYRVQASNDRKQDTMQDNINRQMDKMYSLLLKMNGDCEDG